MYLAITITFEEVVRLLTEGFSVTLVIFFATLLFALPLGLVISFGSKSKFLPLKLLVRGIIWVIRSTPLMLQIIVIFYGLPLMFKINFPSRILAVLVAFVINYACYFSEIFRSGIEGISNGQYEAGQVLGMTKSQIFFKVILMQVIKRTVPPMANEIITLVKDTSLARVITVTELIKQAQDITSTYGIIWPIFFSGLFYLAFNGLLTLLFGYIEKKLSYYKV